MYSEKVETSIESWHISNTQASSAVLKLKLHSKVMGMGVCHMSRDNDLEILKKVVTS